MLSPLQKKTYWATGIAGAVLGLIFYLNIVPALHRQITTPGKAEIWAYVQKESAAHNLDPHFVYAIIFAESSFDPHADVGYARGLMQVSKDAWNTVRKDSWNNAFQWKDNIQAGTAYLAWQRDQLVRNGHFSYPLLAASYRFGLGTVQRADYDISKVTAPRNNTYKALFDGNTNPVAPPQ